MMMNRIVMVSPPVSPPRTPICTFTSTDYVRKGTRFVLDGGSFRVMTSNDSYWYATAANDACPGMIIDAFVDGQQFYAPNP